MASAVSLAMYTDTDSIFSQHSQQKNTPLPIIDDGMEGSFAKNWSCIGSIGKKILTILEEEIKNNQNLKGKICMQELMNY